MFFFSVDTVRVRQTVNYQCEQFGLEPLTDGQLDNVRDKIEHEERDTDENGDPIVGFVTVNDYLTVVQDSASRSR